MTKALKTGVLLRSESTLSELARVLERANFDRYLARYERMVFLDRFIQDTVHVNTQPAILASRESRDRGLQCEAFELLLGLLRHIDDVIFFADEAGSWQVGVDWRTALPAYFRCLAETASAEKYARTVDQAITDFADYERPRHLTAARRVASAAQRAALRALSAARR